MFLAHRDEQSEHEEGGVGRYVPEFLIGSGIFFLLTIFGTWLYYDTLSEGGTTTGVFVSFSIELIYILGLVYGGYWLKNSDIEVSRYPRIAKWTVAGGVFFVAVNLLIMAFYPPGSMEVVVGWIRSVANLGMAVGVLVGTTEARAIQREIAAEREAARAAQMEKTRDLLKHLNGILRHEVLNSVTVIQGNTDIVLEDDTLDDESRDLLETVRSRCDEITEIVDDVRVLIRASQEDETLEPVSLSEAVRREEEKLRESFDDVEVRSTVPDGVEVVGDTLLPRVFSNLLTNAVEHNQGEARVDVEMTVDEDEGTATVRVSDNGPGVPEDIRSSLFKHSNEPHGVGLYLVNKLVDKYGGSIELEETGPEGSVFAVELPLAEENEEDVDEKDGFGGERTGYALAY